MPILIVLKIGLKFFCIIKYESDISLWDSPIKGIQKSIFLVVDHSAMRFPQTLWSWIKRQHSASSGTLTQFEYDVLKGS